MRETQEILPKAVQQQSIELLKTHLAAMIALQCRFESLHRRLRGPDFTMVQAVSTSISVKMSEYCTLLVRRIGAMHRKADASHGPSFEFYRSAMASDESDPVASRIAGLVKAFSDCSRALREGSGQATAFGDRMTGEVFKEVLCGVDRQLWLIETRLLPRLSTIAAGAQQQPRPDPQENFLP
jgi:DNA-binding ferritin-like protein